MGKPILDRLTPKIIAAFWRNVALPEDQAACFHWTGDCGFRKGYPRFSRGGLRIGAHRVALTLKLGREIRPGFSALHLCDTPACVNPRHLVEGDAALNKLQEIVCGRHARGSRIGTAKLNEDTARAAWARLQTGEDRHAIASDLGVSHHTIGDMLNGRTWQHVTGMSRQRAKPVPIPASEFQRIEIQRLQGATLVELAHATGASIKTLREVLKGQALPTSIEAAAP